MRSNDDPAQGPSLKKRCGELQGGNSSHFLMTDSLGGSRGKVLLKLQHAYESLGSLLNCDFSYDGVDGPEIPCVQQAPGDVVQGSHWEDQARHTVASPGELWKHLVPRPPLPDSLT